MRGRRILRWMCGAAAAGLVMATAACEDVLEQSMEDRMRRELEVNRSRWARSDIASYRYLLSVECACPPAALRAVEITVRDGVPVSARYHDDGTAADPALFAGYDTVEELFELIEDALDRRADSITALYETRYALGNPEAIDIDYDEFGSGDELTVLMLTELDILD